MARRFTSIFLAHLASGASIVALLIGIWPTVSESVSQEEGLIRSVGITFIISIGFLLVVIAILSFLHWKSVKDLADLKELKKEVQNYADERNELAGLIHNICHETRNQIYQFARIAATAYEEKNGGEMISRLQRNWSMFNIYFVDNIKKIFDIVTKDSCSVSIKIIEPPDENLEEYSSDVLDSLIRTYFRDALSYRFRRDVDHHVGKYPARYNTAFQKILSPHNEESIFVCDNLKSEKAYVNLNHRWKSFYNATLVVPIRVESLSLLLNDNVDSLPVRHNVIGFLCVDNWDGGFKSKAAIDLLSGFADLYYIILYAFYEQSVARREAHTEPPTGGDGIAGAETV